MKAGKGILVMLLGCFLVSGLWACQGSRQPSGPEVRPDPEASSEALPAETPTPVPPAKTQEPTGEITPTKEQTPTKMPVPTKTQEPTGEVTPTKKQTPAAFPAQDALLSREQVITLVLSRVPGAESGDITSLELEIEDGRWRYEGEVEYQGIEFEFEIDAQNGNVLVWEVDD